MTEDKNTSKSIAISASIATLVVPFLYIFGFAYDQGYLRAYGISNEFFARSVQEYLVLSFMACLNIFSSLLEIFAKKPYLFFILALFFGCIGLAAVFTHKHRLDERLKIRASNTSKHWLFDYIFFPIMSAFFGVTAPFFVITVTCIILLIPGVAYFNGRSIAEKEIETSKPCLYASAPAENCVSLLENGKPMASGRFIARSSTHLALFNQGKTSIYPVKDQLIEVIPGSKKTIRVFKGDAP